MLSIIFMLTKLDRTIVSWILFVFIGVQYRKKRIVTPVRAPCNLFDSVLTFQKASFALACLCIIKCQMRMKWIEAMKNSTCKVINMTGHKLNTIFYLLNFWEKKKHVYKNSFADTFLSWMCLIAKQICTNQFKNWCSGRSRPFRVAMSAPRSPNNCRRGGQKKMWIGLVGDKETGNN